MWYPTSINTELQSSLCTSISVHYSELPNLKTKPRRSIFGHFAKINNSFIYVYCHSRISSKKTQKKPINIEFWMYHFNTNHISVSYGCTNVLSSNPAQARCTRYNSMWWSLSETSGGVGGFLRVLLFPQPINLTATICLNYLWKWR